jgi:hypothetical protein
MPQPPYKWRLSLCLITLSIRFYGPAAFLPGKKTPVSIGQGAWCGPLDAVEKRTICGPCREWNPDHPVYNFVFNSHSEGGGGGDQSGSTRHVGHFWPIVPAPGDGEFCGIKIGRGNRNTWRKPAAGPLCPLQIPFDQTRATAMEDQRLTAWAMARPACSLHLYWLSYLRAIYIKSGTAENRTRDPCVSSQKLWPLDHRGGRAVYIYIHIPPGSDSSPKNFMLSVFRGLWIDWTSASMYMEIMLRNKSIFQISILVCLSSTSICNLLIDLPRITTQLKTRATIFGVNL